MNLPILIIKINPDTDLGVSVCPERFFNTEKIALTSYSFIEE